MDHIIAKTGLCAMVAAIFALPLLLAHQGRAAQDKVSAFGKYRGYSQETYNGVKRTSAYLTLPNGTRLAYDLILPTKDDNPADVPLPVLFKYTPYLRNFTIFDRSGRNIIADLINLGWKERAMLRLRYWLSPEGRYMDPLFRTGWLKNMVRHGYAVIVVERPGTGASFGTWDPSHEPGGPEAGDIMDWIASQPWSNGKIGMFGDSFQAMIQMAAAATGNRHLKAIFPTSAPLEMYQAIMYPGGVYNKAFSDFFQWATSFLQSDAVTPVDTDPDGVLLARARAERNRMLPETVHFAGNIPFRDNRTPQGTDVWQDRSALYPLLGKINHANVPIYLTNGWYDIFTSDMLLWHQNLTVPRKLTVRPLDHSEVEKNGQDLDYGAEAHRWFDYWLKGIDNGIMDEPAIHYYVMETAKKGQWRETAAWPPANQKLTRFYFNSEKTGSTASGNNSLLSEKSPEAIDAADACTVDYTATTGKNARWSAVNWPRHYPEMQANDAKGLAYTTAPLEAGL